MPPKDFLFLKRGFLGFFHLTLARDDGTSHSTLFVNLLKSTLPTSIPDGGSHFPEALSGEKGRELGLTHCSIVNILFAKC